MERDYKCQRTRKIKLLKTLEPNKRTISSQQGHYRHTRKLTLENQQTKKNLYKNTTMGRKNQSLPKSLNPLNMYNTNTNVQPHKNYYYRQINSNKRTNSINSIHTLTSAKLHSENMYYEKQKLSEETILNKFLKNSNKKISDAMCQAELLFTSQKYEEAYKKLEQINMIAKNQYPKCNYFRGLCQYKLKNIDNSIYILSKLLEKEHHINFEIPLHVYQILAEGYEQTKNYICALKMLDEWLNIQKNQRAYLMRARTHFLFKQYQKAIQDYVCCYQLNPKRLQAYIEQAEATYQNDGFDASLDKYNNLLVNYKSIWPEFLYEDINYVKYKKSLLLLHQKHYSNSLSLLEQVSNSELQSEVHYYQGIIHIIKNNYQEALMKFSKAIEANTQAKFVTQSIYQRFVILFKKNDYYGIQHELDLLDENQILQNEALKMMSKTVAGVIKILKMDFTEGIKVFDQLVLDNKYYINTKQIQKIFKCTIMSFKGFAYYSQQKFQEALHEFESLLKSKSSHSSQQNQYNYIMLKGIMYCLEGQYSQSFKNFEKAEEIQPFNSHTLMAKAITQIIFYCSLIDLKEEKFHYKLDRQEQSKKQSINSEYPPHQKYVMRKKTEYLHQKNRKRTSVSKKKESLTLSKPAGNSSSVAKTNLKAEMTMIDLSSGALTKTLTQSQNKQILLSAQQLLNRCLLKQPQNDQILYILSCIYYTLEQYETGLKYIRKAIESSEDHMIKHYYIKANCKIMLDMINEAINDYSNGLLVMAEQQMENAKQDGTIIDHVQETIMEIYLQRAKCYILIGAKDKAQADLKIFFNHLESVKKYENELDLFMHVGCPEIIIEIYKNILNKQYDLYSRMKCYYLSKELNNCLTVMNALLDFQESEESQSPFDPSELSVDRDCLESLRKSSQGAEIMMREALRTFEKILIDGSFGNIFTKADCMFYAGVLSFYTRDYSKAKNYFIDAKGEKLLLNQIEQSSIEEQGGYQNRMCTLEEINYNIGICDFIQGKWSPYLDDFSSFKKFHQSNTQNLLDSAQQITPFPIKNRLCSIYGPEKQGNVLYRLSFCLPKMKLREVSFGKNQQILKKIRFKDIDMRPSAPWIQKNKKGIVFTGQIAQESIDLKSEKSKKVLKNKRGQNRYKQQF